VPGSVYFLCPIIFRLQGMGSPGAPPVNLEKPEKHHFPFPEVIIPSAIALPDAASPPRASPALAPAFLTFSPLPDLGLLCALRKRSLLVRTHGQSLSFFRACRFPPPGVLSQTLWPVVRGVVRCHCLFSHCLSPSLGRRAPAFFFGVATRFRL